MNKRTIALLAAVPLVVLALNACGSSAGTAGSASQTSKPANGNAAAPNPTDIAFAQAMIPPQQQALQMAKLAATQASSSDVKALAARIESSQDPQLSQLTACVKRWKQTMPGNMMGMGGMPGMMSSADLSDLTSTSGLAFDKKFLTVMIAHHTGAMTLAQAELSHGVDPAAKAVARAAIDGQTHEITEMRALLGS